ncbi:hypothetical protein ERJ75_001337100 [Trypanosoma vivax]|nr:hypothetical protein ERJ75_001337100 [Trypanosoma vivax]
MTPPPPPSPPVVASVVQQPSWQDPVATVKATASKGKTLFSIAPPSEQVNDNVWAKSSVSYLDEEIERARSTRPLVCSPDIAGDVSQQLRLNVTSPKVGNETASSSPKENLKPLPEMESASLDLHEVPDSISEKASIPGTLVTGDKSSEPRVSQPVDLAEVVASESEAGHQGMTRRADVERRLASDCPCAAAMSEQDPRCPWTDSVPTSDESVAPLMVSYDDVNEHVATCVLQDTPASVMDVVRAMHEAITRIEHDNGGRAVAVTHVLLTSLPTIDFFRTKRGPLEFSPSERVELLRAKEHLFARIAGGSHLTFVAIAHGGNVEDFAAELFISCHHRVFIKPAETTLGFPSIRLGDFPASCTVRKLARLLGARVAAATMSHLHEYSAETLVHVGVVQTAGSVREVIPMLSGVRGMDRVKVFSCVLLFRVWLVHAARSVLPGLAQRATFSKMLYCSDPLAQSAIPNAQRNPLLDAWCRYCVAAIAEGKRMSASGSCVNTKGRRSSTAAMFEEVAYSSAAINSATVYSLRPRMRRREFSTLPRVGCLTFLADEMERWWTKTRALSSKERSGITILLDCSLGCLEATAKLLKDHQDAITETNVVLMGDEHVARQLMSTLHCSVVILVSPASQHSTSVLGTLREVRVFSDSSCSDDIRASVLSSVLLYLQQRDIPYVVCRSCCSKRLTAVLVAEACRLSLICDLERIERISEQMLGLVSGPFRLADRWGADAMLRMMDERDSAGSRGNPLSHDLLPAVGRRALQCMFNDGFSGSKAPRGGFYKYHGDGTIAGLNPEIQRCYLQRRLTDVELSDRLLAVVVNECCELLLAGHLSTATDANMLTIAALGFHESTGGALALADGIGIDALVEKMEELAEWHGPHLQPSPLLKCMAHSRVSFASVSEAIIQSART